MFEEEESSKAEGEALSPREQKSVATVEEHQQNHRYLDLLFTHLYKNKNP